MTYTEQAISIALENNWKLDHIANDVITGNPANTLWFLRDNKHGQLAVCNDPAFWRALGRGLGWDRYTICKDCELIARYIETYNAFSGREICDCSTANDINTDIYQWHRFIDHLQAEKDTESYFKNLLEK